MHLPRNSRRTQEKKVLGVSAKLMENDNKVSILLRKSVLCLIVFDDVKRAFNCEIKVEMDIYLWKLGH